VELGGPPSSSPCAAGDAEQGYGGAAEEGVSLALVSNALERIAERTRGVDSRAAVPLRPAIKVGAACAALAALLLAAYLLRPAGVSNALARLFHPGRDVPFYSYTRLHVSPGDCVVATGDVVSVGVHVSGMVPRRARLQGRRGELDQRDSALRAGRGGLGKRSPV